MKLGKASRYSTLIERAHSKAMHFHTWNMVRAVDSCGLIKTYMRQNTPTASPPRTDVPVNRPFGSRHRCWTAFFRSKFGQVCDFPNDVWRQDSTRESCFNFDKMFNTLRISEPRGRYVETYQLDLHDRVTSVTNIEGQAMDIEYYVGDMVSKTTRFDGSVVSNAYDSVGRLASSRISNSEHGTPNIEVNYTYWPDGEIKTVSDGISTIANSYDRLNRVAGVTNQTAGITAVVNHQYDGVNLTNTSVSVGGSSSTSTAYEYDAAERLEVLTTENTEYTEQFVYGYNSENGKIASVSNTVPGLVCEYEYDLLDRATNIVYTLGTNLIRSLDYEFDDVSMIEKKTIHGRGEAVASLRVTSTSYAYDSLDRLVAEKRTGGTSSTSSYTYDLEATASPKPPMASKPHTHWELEIALHQAPPPQTPRSSFKARPTN